MPPALPCATPQTQLDKEALQATIRALTREAALLAEQAQRALLPAPLPGSAPVAPPAAAPGGAAAAVEQEGLSLVRDWSLALSVASSTGSGGSGRQPGAAWQPATSVRCFECGISGAEGGAATAYVQGGDGEGTAGDKRRRLAPGMLACCIREAVAEAAAMEAASEAGGCCRQPTPGRTPKRKLRQLSSGSLVAQPAAAAGEAAADLPKQQPQAAALVPAVAAEAGAEAGAEAEDFRTFELFEAKWHGAAKAPAPAAAAQQQRSGCRIM